jgi:hypothetical protein
MFKTYGIFFVLFCALGLTMVMRTWVRIPLFGHNVIHATGYVFVMSVITIVILYMAVLSYSYGVFPYIPAAKGGADFSFSPKLTIQLKPAGGETTPPLTIENAIALYSTLSSIYVAQPIAGSDACDWRAHKARPNVTEVVRAEIRTVSSKSLDLRRGQTNCF